MHWSHLWYFFFIFFIATISPKHVSYNVRTLVSKKLLAVEMLTILFVDGFEDATVGAVADGFCARVLIHYFNQGLLYNFPRTTIIAGSIKNSESGSNNCLRLEFEINLNLQTVRLGYHLSSL